MDHHHHHHHVQVISTEFIKPSSPTPEHLRTYKLSLMDQMFSNIYVPLIFFYSAKHKNFSEVYDLLKQSLAKTLTQNYPFAGRLNDRFSVHCNDKGASLSEAHVSSDMSMFLQRPNVKMIQQLAPPNPKLRNERELLTVQVNFFRSGEVAIGAWVSHALADGSTVANFMKLWGEISRGVNSKETESNISGFISDCSSFFPPQKILEDQYFKPPTPTPTPTPTSTAVFKRLVFDGKTIAALKEKLNQEMGHSNEFQATRFTVVSSLIWGASIATARERNKALSSYPLYYTNNLRHKMNPPLNPQRFGNIFRFVRVEWSAGSPIDVADLVGELTKAKRKVSGAVNSAEYSGLMKEMNETRAESKSLTLTSIVGLPYYEVDFGWGKPLWFSLGEALVPNCAFLTSTSDGEGVEALVVMFKEDMDRFERNPCITAYASSNPSVI